MSQNLRQGTGIIQYSSAFWKDAISQSSCSWRDTQRALVITLNECYLKKNNWGDWENAAAYKANFSHWEFRSAHIEVSSRPALQWCSWKSWGGGKPISFTRFSKSVQIQDSELCDHMIRVQVYAVLSSYATYWESSVLMAHWRNTLFVKWWYELTLQMEAFLNSVCWWNEHGGL